MFGFIKVGGNTAAPLMLSLNTVIITHRQRIPDILDSWLNMILFTWIKSFMV